MAILAPTRLHRESSRERNLEGLVAAQHSRDLAPGDAGFAGPGHCRRDVLVDKISGGVTGTSQLVEVGQGHGGENIQIVCAKGHGQIFAPSPHGCDPRGSVGG